MNNSVEKIVIGRRDRADFPSLGLFDIDVKIDTGAYTSSIHCHNIEVVAADGGKQVRFNLLDPSHADYDEKEFVLPIARVKYVKSSSGASEKRFFIKTQILLFEELIELELSLTDRSDMKFPVLLGRKLLKKRFIVDVARFNLSYRSKQKHSKRSERI